MAGISDDRLSEIEVAYRAGLKSVNALAKEFEIPESSLRRLAKKKGWVQDAPGRKRRIVADHFAGLANGVANGEVRQMQEDAAQADIDDMQTGLDIARNCLSNLLEVSEDCKDPRVIKTIIESNKLAIETIRKIRGLDAPMDFSNMSDEEVAALARGMAPK